MRLQELESDIFNISSYNATIPMEWLRRLLKIGKHPATNTGLALWFFAKQLNTCEFVISRKMISDLFHYSRTSPLRGLRILAQNGLISLQTKDKGKPNTVTLLSSKGTPYSAGALNYTPLDVPELTRLKYSQKFRNSSTKNSNYLIKNPSLMTTSESPELDKQFKRNKKKNKLKEELKKLTKEYEQLVYFRYQFYSQSNEEKIKKTKLRLEELNKKQYN